MSSMRDWWTNVCRYSCWCTGRRAEKKRHHLQRHNTLTSHARAVTRSICMVQRRVVVKKNLGMLNISWAAAFWMSCRGWGARAGRPADLHLIKQPAISYSCFFQSCRWLHHRVLNEEITNGMPLREICQRQRVLCFLDFGQGERNN